MAENFGSVVLEAFFSGQQNKMKREQLQQQKVHNEEQMKLQQAKLAEDQKQFQEQLRLKDQQFNTEIQLKKADHDLRKTLANSVMMERNANMVGKGTASLRKNDDGSYTPQLFETPQQVGTAQAEIAQPALDAKTEQTLTTQNNAAANQITVGQKLETQREQHREVMQKLNHASAKELVELRQKGAEKLEGIRNSYALGRLKTAAELRNAVANGEASDDVEDMATGDFTEESFRVLGYKPNQRQAAYQAAKLAGVKILSNKQVAGVQGLVALQGIIEKVRELNEDIKKAPMIEKAGKWIPDIVYKTELQARRDQLTTQAGTILKQIGNDTGTISDKDVARAETNIPDIYVVIGKATNDERMAAFEKDYFNTVNKVLSVVPSEEQRYELAKRYGIKLRAQKGVPDRVPVK